MKTLALILTAVLLVVSCAVSLGLFTENALLRSSKSKLEDQNFMLKKLVVLALRVSSDSNGVAEYCDNVMREFLLDKGLAPNLERMP